MVFDYSCLVVQQPGLSTHFDPFHRTTCRHIAQVEGSPFSLKVIDDLAKRSYTMPIGSRALIAADSAKLPRCKSPSEFNSGYWVHMPPKRRCYRRTAGAGAGAGAGADAGANGGGSGRLQTQEPYG